MQTSSLAASVISQFRCHKSTSCDSHGRRGKIFPDFGDFFSVFKTDRLDGFLKGLWVKLKMTDWSEEGDEKRKSGRRGGAKESCHS